MDVGPGTGGRPGIGEGLGAELELDQLLAQLIDRAQDVRSAQNRLRGLLEANRSIISDLSLEVVLRRIVEAACHLLDARYGALGVLNPDGSGLEQFVHVGIDQATVDRIGDLPQGKGVLGALIEQPQPIALHELAEDPRSVGFPEGHPPMHTFLGVPITIRGEVFGNLYITERTRGYFSAEDVDLASAFAATAAVAIENARLFEDARRRQVWLRATADVSLRIVTSPTAEPLRVVAEQIRQLADADIVTVVLPEEDGSRLGVEVAVGLEADRLEGISYPLAGTLSEVVLTSGEPAMVTGADSSDDRTVQLREVLEIGPAMVLPLAGRDRVQGALVVGRLSIGHPFTESDLEMAATFASQAAIALELAESRRDRERMQLFEDRDRIARDLHDHVIQQLFAAGLTLQGISMGLAGTPDAERIERVVEGLDGSIKQIRNSIFELRDRLGPESDGVRSAVLGLAGDLSEVLGFEPRVRFVGPVDTVVEPELRDDLLAVVREALTNAAKHASASRVEVLLSASSRQVRLVVSDDGRGVGTPGRRSGLDNIAERAQRRGGDLSTAAPEEGTGTVLTWVVPATIG